MSMLIDLRKVLKGKSFLLQVKIKPVYREHIDNNRMIFSPWRIPFLIDDCSKK